MKLKLQQEQSLPTGVLGFALDAGGERGYAACVDGVVRVVHLERGVEREFAARHESYASGCVVGPDGTTVVSAGYDGRLLWHEVATGRCWRTVQAHRFWSWQLASSPDGRWLATVTGQYLPGGWKYEPAPETERSVKVFDALTGALVAAFEHRPPVLSCAFSPDGRHLAAANMLGEVRVWDLHAPGQPDPVVRWETPDFTSWGSVKTHHYCGGIYGLAFSPDSKSLVGCGMGPMGDPMAGNGKMTWQRWDWRAGTKRDQIQEGQHGAGLMEALAWDPAGRHFVMAGRQAQGTWNLAVFDSEKGGLLHSIDTRKRITQARFSPDGRRLVVVGAQGQPQRKKDGEWPAWGKVQVYEVEA